MHRQIDADSDSSCHSLLPRLGLAYSYVSIAEALSQPSIVVTYLSYGQKLLRALRLVSYSHTFLTLKLELC